MANLDYEFNPFTVNLDAVRSETILQIKFDSLFEDFSCWLRTNTVINASGEIELAAL